MKPVVLIVDDSDTNRYLLTFEVQRRGCEALSAKGGREALQLAADRPPRLVFLDLHMPEMDGFEVAAGLRALPGLAALPIVVVTANVSEQTRRAVLAAGFAGFIPKPVDFSAVAAALRQHLALPPP